jgi:hypothetical protein
MRKPKGIKVTPQRKNWDCGIAALAMLLSKEYADVSAAGRARFTAERLKRNGMTIYEVEELAELFGFKLKRHYKGNSYLEGKTGILGLNEGKPPKRHNGHWVVLKDGTHIVDPDGGEIWGLEDYLKKFDRRTATLLTIE